MKKKLLLDYIPYIVSLIVLHFGILFLRAML
ncbi:hypothetical protein [Caudoviricetes sp.]|nr:hypothetical protein [Caudoviricetes sp.]